MATEEITRKTKIKVSSKYPFEKYKFLKRLELNTITELVKKWIENLVNLDTCLISSMNPIISKGIKINK